ncbi:MAG: M1 family metallopeptidase [Ferruginibacter sp.]|nr:M1 family metallopeptidase [Ferruginibacter sp.]
MRNFYLSIWIFLIPILGKAQNLDALVDTSWRMQFRNSAPKINDLVHTKLDVRFDFNKSYLYGKEWLTLQPHFNPTDSLLLDAKGMDIKEVSLVKDSKKTPLKYTYVNDELNIKLDKSYTRQEKYTLYFEYTSKPNELNVKGSAAITDAKGLYFINPTGNEKNKPTQIWTQGETESNSTWMITIDKPNQKTTQEISMTVPDRYVTLSNGLLKSQVKNSDGTRTDNWLMDLPHAPYLFFMGVGEYEVLKDSYNGKEVSYYVEKAYAPYALGIFGNTPEMMKLFSEKLGVEFPWQKYAQIVGRDYVSGAMENTTSTLHQESAYQNARQLVDGNRWEETIAHELFHQWFGDLVTTESWSNITVNESFANYSEYVWFEYKYGKDFADAHNYNDMQGYLMSGSENKDLVRYFYASKEDVFDAVSYNKGGRILHMLRNHVGDDAFFASLNKYLTDNKFKTGEAAQLRLSFEEITGKDLNWFWNQWYYGSGHPVLNISYDYSTPGKAGVIIKQQTEKIFTLPVAVEMYADGKKSRYQITISSAADSFYFNTAKKPEWISVDADKILLGVFKDNKSKENYLAQWKYGKKYLDRKEALDFFAKNNMVELIQGLNDPFPGLRSETIANIESSDLNKNAAALKQIEKMAASEPSKKTRAAAISFLSKTGDKKYEKIYKSAINDSSYSVAGAALNGLAELNPADAYTLAKKYSGDAKGALSNAINTIVIKEGNESDYGIVSKSYDEMPLSEEKIYSSMSFIDFLNKMNDQNKIKDGIDKVASFRKMIPEQYRMYVDMAIKDNLDKLGKSKGREIEDYIKEKMK